MIEKVKIEKDIKTIEAVFNNLNDDFPNFNKQSQVVKGFIKDIKETEGLVFVDIGLKSDGVVPLSEFFKDGVKEEVKIGDLIEVFLHNLDKRGKPFISRSRVLYLDSEKNLQHAFKNDEEVSGILFSIFKNMGIVDLNGVIGCIPSSELGERDSFSSILMKSCKYHISHFDQNESIVTLSRKRIIDTESAQKTEQFFETHKVGDVVKGYINSITDIAAYIRIEGIDVDAMLHAFDIKWERNARDQINPHDFLTIGQEVEVKIMKVEKETKRISVSMKHLKEDHWSDLIAQFKEGQTVKGKITEITDYGAFLELSENVEGLLHISELTWGKDSQIKHKSLKSGETLEVRIISIEPERHRVHLSLKDLLPNPCKAFNEQHPANSIINAKISKVAKYGVFVEFSNLESLVHLNELSWFSLDSYDIEESYKIGDEIKILYIGLDEKTNRFILSVKQITPNPFEKYKDQLVIGSKVKCKVLKIRKDKLVVEIFSELQSEILRSNLPNNINKYEPGTVTNAQVLSLDEFNRPLLSVRKFEETEYNNYKARAEAESSTSIASILGVALGDLDTGKEKKNKK